MKKLILFGLFFLTIVLEMNSQTTHNLTIIFSGVTSDIGDIYVGLHNKKDNFLKKHYREAVIKIENQKAKAVFKNLPQGEYAISAFHDENDNKKLDTNFIGIPKEPIGISNNAKGFMGPPKYKDAKFLIDTNREVEILIQ